MKFFENIKNWFSRKKDTPQILSKKEMAKINFFEKIKDYQENIIIGSDNLKLLYSSIVNYTDYYANTKIEDEEVENINLFLNHIINNIDSKDKKNNLIMYMKVFYKINRLHNLNYKMENLIISFVKDTHDFVNIVKLKNSEQFIELSNFISLNLNKDFFTDFYQKASYSEKIKIQKAYLENHKIYNSFFYNENPLLPENKEVFINYVKKNKEKGLFHINDSLCESYAFIYKDIVENIINKEGGYEKIDIYRLLQYINSSFLLSSDIKDEDKISNYKETIEYIKTCNFTTEELQYLIDKSFDIDEFSFKKTSELNKNNLIKIVFEEMIGLIGLFDFSESYSIEYDIKKIIDNNKDCINDVIESIIDKPDAKFILDLLLFKDEKINRLTSEEINKKLFILDKCISIKNKEKIIDEVKIFDDFFDVYHHLENPKEVLDKYIVILKFMKIHPEISQGIANRMINAVHKTESMFIMMNREEGSFIPLNELLNKMQEEEIEFSFINYMDSDFANDYLKLSELNFLNMLKIEYKQIEKYTNDSFFQNELLNSKYKEAYLYIKGKIEMEFINEKLEELDCIEIHKKKRL